VATETDPLEARGLGSAGFFAREHYGEDRLVPGRPLLRRSDAATLRAWFDLTPMPEALKAGLVRLYTDRGDTMPGLPVAEKIARLRAMSYLDYLREHLRLPREALDYVLMGGSGDGDNTSAGPDTFSAWYAWRRNRPGLDGLGLPSTPRLSHPAPEPGPHVAFPDGNAGVARLLARALVPGSLPGSSAEDSIGSRLQYERLDLPGNDVRIRLSSTVVRVAHRGQAQAAEGVEAVYLQDGRLRRVRWRTWRASTPWCRTWCRNFRSRRRRRFVWRCASRWCARSRRCATGGPSSAWASTTSTARACSTVRSTRGSGPNGVAPTAMRARRTNRWWCT
jgi:spermidine dehydrogenase